MMFRVSTSLFSGWRYMSLLPLTGPDRVSWTPQLAVRASMCAAEIVHYRVDRVVKKTRQGLKEQACSVLHHDKTINRMLGCLQKLEEERLEIDQYQKLSEVVQAWDTHIDSLECLRSQGVRDANTVALHYRTEIEDLKAQMMAMELGNQLQIQQLKECCGAVENVALEAVHRIGALETQVGVSSLLLACQVTDQLL